MDLEIEVNKVKGIGMLAVQQTGSYELKIKAPGDSDVVTFTPCTTEKILRKQDEEFKFKYQPKEIAVRKNCVAKIEAFAPKFRYAAGLIVFTPPGGAQATIDCDEAPTYKATGAAVCQSKAGIYAEVVFDNPVDTPTPAEGCEAWKFEGNRASVHLSKGVCQYLFREKDAEGKRFAITTHGYEEFSIFR